MTTKAAQHQLHISAFARSLAIAYAFSINKLYACAFFLPRSSVNNCNNANFGQFIHHHRHCTSSGVTIPLHLSSESDDSNTINHRIISPPNVLCVGETLWDYLPSGMFLGGAPTNVSVYLASLFKSSSSSPSSTIPTVAIAACLGEDQLGKEAQRRLSIKGVRTDYLQFHPGWETGMAIAIIDENGDATYEFNTPAAWDGLCLEEQFLGLMENESVNDVVFVMGTIAGRLQNNNEHGATSSTTLATIRNGAPEGTVVLDVNLRSPWYTPESVLKLARGTTTAKSSSEGSSDDEQQSPSKLALLKLNEEELVILEQWCELKGEYSDEDEDDGLTGSVLKERMARLATSLNAQRVCVTRGKDGAALLCKGNNENNNIQFYELA